MDKLRLLLRIVKKYPTLLALNIVFNILSACLSIFSLLMMIPFLQVLFYQGEQINKLSELPKFPFLDYIYLEWVSILTIHGKQNALLILCLVLIFAFLLKNGTRYLAAFFLVSVRTGLMRDLRMQIYQKLLSLDFTFFQNKRRGDILTRFGSDVQEVEYGIINFIETGIKEPVTIAFTLGSLVIMSPYLTIWVLVLLPVSALIIGKIGKQLKRDSFKAQYQLSLLQILVDEVMHGIRVIQSFKNVDVFSEKFQHINQEYKVLHSEMLRRKELASPLSEVLGIVVIVAILLIGGNAIFQGDSSLTPEVFITYIVVFSQIISPSKAFSNAWYFIQKGVASLQRIQDLLEEKSFYDNINGTLSKSSFDQDITIQNLSYSFGDKTVLKDIHLKISKGQKIAFVGPSGSGKTTLLRLLSRTYSLPDNHVFIDGECINKIKLEDYRALFAIVTQDPILFYGTIEENLKVAKSNASHEEMIDALHHADALNFVLDLPESLATNIGERGHALSGGQQQRIALARAYLKEAPVLLLDEVSSSLDGVSDLSIRNALSKITHGKTVISIAHRLASIYDYDQIVFFEDGKITGKGTHLELMETHLPYRQMVNSQQIFSES